MFGKKQSPKQWFTPGGNANRLYLDMLEQCHVFISGSQTKDRDSIRNGFVYTSLYKSPVDIRFVLFDLAGLYLVDYAALPHTMSYVSDLEKAILTMRNIVDIIDGRLAEYQESKTIFPSMWVIVDGYDVLSLRYGKQVESLIFSILSKGRMARVHLFLLAAYCKPYGGIDEIFPAYGCLNGTTSSKIRRITGIANVAPPINEIIYKSDTVRCERLVIPNIDDEQMTGRIQWWVNQCGKKGRK